MSITCQELSQLSSIPAMGRFLTFPKWESSVDKQMLNDAEILHRLYHTFSTCARLAFPSKEDVFIPCAKATLQGRPGRHNRGTRCSTAMLALIFHLGSLECHDPSRYVKHTFLSYRTHQRDLRDEDYDRALLGFIFLPPWEQQDGAARRKIKVEHFFAIPGRLGGEL